MNQGQIIKEIDLAFEEERYIECIAMVNIWVENIVRLMVRNWKDKVFVDKKIPLEYDNQITDWIEHTRLSSLIHASFLMEVIDSVLYGKLRDFNKERNNFTHNLDYIYEINKSQVKKHKNLGKDIINSMLSTM